jgi:TPR repeat protein
VVTQRLSLIISCLYARGRGVAEDQAHALEWLRDAAEGGHAESQCILGSYYARGFLVPRSYDDAAKWYNKSAVQGCDWAQERLAQLYYLGRGVPSNFVLAHMWASLAMDPVIDENAPEPIAQLRDKVESEMTRDQIAEAQRLAKEWSPYPKPPIDGRPDFNPRSLLSDTL